MALVKCPNCNQTVLSVASVCPKCGFLLTQHRGPERQHGALTECRRCGGQVSSTARKCPYCGSYRPAKSFAVHPGVVIAVLVSVLAAGAATSVVRRLAAPTPASLLPAPAEPTPSEPAPAAPVPTPSEPTRNPSIIVPPPGQATSPPVATSVPPHTRVRFTVNWANVRAAPDSTAPVVRVLRPAQRVEVADRQGRWWSAWLDGEPIGFVANAILVDDSLAALDAAANR